MHFQTARIVHFGTASDIAMSMPGTGFVSATAILAEIGNCTDFKKPEQLAAWCGLVPSLYQSAEKTDPGRDNQTRLQAYPKNVDSSRLCNIANQRFKAEEILLEDSGQEGI